MRRGLKACGTEWALMMTTHNLRKLRAASTALCSSFAAACRYLWRPEPVAL